MEKIHGNFCTFMFKINMKHKNMHVFPSLSATFPSPPPPPPHYITIVKGLQPTRVRSHLQYGTTSTTVSLSSLRQGLLKDSGSGVRVLIGRRRGSQSSNGELATLQRLQEGVVCGFVTECSGGQRWNGIWTVGYETRYRDVPLLLPRAASNSRSVSRRLSSPTGLPGQSSFDDWSVLLCSKERVILDVCCHRRSCPYPAPPPGAPSPSSSGSPRRKVLRWKEERNGSC